jgi:hypothetical protein
MCFVTTTAVDDVYMPWSVLYENQQQQQQLQLTMCFMRMETAGFWWQAAVYVSGRMPLCSQTDCPCPGSRNLEVPFAGTGLQAVPPKEASTQHFGVICQ